MHEFLEFTIIGIVLGSAYAVAASGLVVTYSTSGIFNIAHGAIGMFMAFVYWQLSVGWHINTGLAFVLTVFVLAPLLGAVVERTVIQWMDPSNVATTLAVTVGLTLLFFGLVNNYIWKPTARTVPQFFGFSGFSFLGVHIDWEEAITVGAAVAIAVGLRLFLYRTRTGIAMRGVVDNRPLIGLFGGRPARLSTLSWSIGASLASVAGILVAPRLQLQPLILTLLVIDAYAAAVIGRLRSLPMTFVGGLVVGLLSSYAQGYIPDSGSFWSSAPVQGLLTQSVPSVILFVALLMLPAHRLRSGVVQRHAPLAPAGLARSLQGGVLLIAAVWVAVSFMGPANIIKLGIGLAFGLICLSLVPLTGWGGYASICQLTFAGLGAFAMYKFGSGGSLVGPGGGGRDRRRRGRPGGAAGPARARALPRAGHHGLRQRDGQRLLPLVGHLRFQRLGRHRQAVVVRTAVPARPGPSPSSWPWCSHCSPSPSWPCAGVHSAGSSSR